MKHYDLIVIGSGPAGEKAAVKAAYHGKSVAVVEKESMLGGAGTNTGTLPSKTLKETALYYSGINESGLWGVDKELKRAADAEDFFFRKNEVQDFQELGIEKNFMLHNIDVYKGRGTVINPHRVQVVGVDDELIEGDFILIATGCVCMALCLMAQGVVIVGLLHWLHRAARKGQLGSRALHGFFILLIAMTVQVFCIFAQIGIWAGLFIGVDEFSDWSTAFYFSMVNFATLGYGDIVMTDEHRILGAVEAVNGVMMLGITTSLLYTILNALLQRTWRMMDKAEQEH